MEVNEMKLLFQKLSEEAIIEFKKAVLENLEAFKDINVDWERHSGFPFLKTTSKEYYLQKDFEIAIEHYVRYILIYHVFSGLLQSKDSEHNIEFLEYVPEAMQPGIRTNREFEKRMGFEFIEYRAERRIGFRYTFLPSGKPITTSLIKQIEDERISEIVIIDWSLQKTASKPPYNEAPCFAGINVRYVTLYDFFDDYLSVEIYEDFIKYLQNTVEELKDYLGVSTIPRLTPPLLFGFRYTVEETLINHMASLESQRNTWKSAYNQGKKVIPAYRVIDAATRTNPHYTDLEKRSLELLYNTCGLKNYKLNKRYRALIGRGNFARCLITSEYLYNIYGKSDQFDYTAVASGYVKSIEQLMYSIALFFIDKKPNGKYFQIAPVRGEKRNTEDFTTQNLNDGVIDTTLGALCFFFKNNKRAISFGNPYKETLLNCLFCYAEECRNDSFHKHNIDEWSRIEVIRSNTFFLYMMLLGCCSLGNREEEIRKKLSVAEDDRISRIYFQLTTHDTLDYYFCFGDQEIIEVCRPREDDYPSFDKYGLLKGESLVLEVEHFNGLQSDKPATITITKDHLPTRIWYEEEEDCSIVHDLEF